MTTFGEQLERFALTADIVRPDTFGEVMKIVAEYLERNLDAAYVEVLRQSAFTEGGKDVQSLSTEWASSGGQSDWKDQRVRLPTRDFNGQVSCAYGRDVDLWITAADRAPLTAQSAYHNHWGTTPPDLPPFVNLTQTEIRTSIIKPLRTSRGRPPVGVLNIESKRFLTPNSHIERELGHIAEAIRVLFQMKWAYVAQIANTGKATGQLRQVGQSPFTSEPKIFFASGNTAADDVVALVNTFFADNELVESFAYKPWKREAAGGSIVVRIWERIHESRIGVCYLSEPSREGGEHRYADNPNALFEAGMMQAMRESPTALMEDWIPIRERDSPDIPFDLSTERVVIVPRHADGTLNQEDLRDRLRNRVAETIAKLFGSRSTVR